jgi:hypothetical protein
LAKWQQQQRLGVRRFVAVWVFLKIPADGWDSRPYLALGVHSRFSFLPL